MPASIWPQTEPTKFMHPLRPINWVTWENANPKYSGKRKGSQKIQEDTEGGGAISNTRGYRRRCLQAQITIRRRDTEHVECISLKVLLS